MKKCGLAITMRTIFRMGTTIHIVITTKTKIVSITKGLIMDITTQIIMGIIMMTMSGLRMLAIIMIIGEVHKDMLEVLIIIQIIVTTTIITETIRHMASKVLFQTINMIINIHKIIILTNTSQQSLLHIHIHNQTIPIIILVQKVKELQILPIVFMAVKSREGMDHYRTQDSLTQSAILMSKMQEVTLLQTNRLNRVYQLVMLIIGNSVEEVVLQGKDLLLQLRMITTTIIDKIKNYIQILLSKKLKIIIIIKSNH